MIQRYLLVLAAAFVTQPAFANLVAFTPTGGTTVTFTTSASNLTVFSPGFGENFLVTATNGDKYSVTFYDPSYFVGTVDGPIDFGIKNTTRGGPLYNLVFNYDGPILFSEANGTLYPGIYGLTNDAHFNNGTGSITISSNATVPEPSTMVLLGIGVAGLVGSARRKFLRTNHLLGISI